MLCFEKDQLSRYRPVIFIGPPDSPSEALSLTVGTWSYGLRKAQRRGLVLYFSTYATRYGFKHPEDPTRDGSEGPLPASVVSVRHGDNYHYTGTYDQDPEVTSVAS